MYLFPYLFTHIRMDRDTYKCGPISSCLLRPKVELFYKWYYHSGRLFTMVDCSSILMVYYINISDFHFAQMGFSDRSSVTHHLFTWSKLIIILCSEFKVTSRLLVRLRFRITRKSWRIASSVSREQWCYQQVQILKHTMACYPSRKGNC